MARAKKRAAKTARKGAARRRTSGGTDAITLLKADHRQVESLFKQFESTRSDAKKKQLADQICRALRVHTMIEEEIFYPAFLEATEDKEIHHEAEVEHNGAKNLISEIEGSGPQDDYFDAKVSVLSEMIKHHVTEEEKRDGMFGKATQSDMDLTVLGEQLAARKKELQAEGGEDEESSTRSARSASHAGRGVLARLSKRM